MIHELLFILFKRFACYQKHYFAFVINSVAVRRNSWPQTATLVSGRAVAEIHGIFDPLSDAQDMHLFQQFLQLQQSCKNTNLHNRTKKSEKPYFNSALKSLLLQNIRIFGKEKRCKTSPEDDSSSFQVRRTSDGEYPRTPVDGICLSGSARCPTYPDKPGNYKGKEGTCELSFITCCT